MVLYPGGISTLGLFRLRDLAWANGTEMGLIWAGGFGVRDCIGRRSVQIVNQKKSAHPAAVWPTYFTVRQRPRAHAASVGG